MKRADFGKFLVFVVLISIVVGLAFWLNNSLPPWFTSLQALLFGLFGAGALWKYWQRPLTIKSQQIQEQAKEIKKLYEELRQFESLLENANDIVYTVDMAGRFTYVNAVTTRIIGYKPHMLIGRRFADFMKPEAQHDLNTSLQSDGFQRVEIEFSTLNGRYVPLEINGRFVYTDGKATAVLGIARDISERKQQDQELKQAAQTAELAMITRTSFLNNMGHELRTPLSVILGYTDMIIQKAETEEDADLLTLAQKVKRYAKDFSAIINDLLRMSEIESGQVGFLLEAFHIENVVRQAIKQVQTHLDVNNNDLMLMIPPDIGTMIADRDKVRIVLVNLLSNAAKFTQDGTITFRVSRKRIADQSWIIFQISDTGIGIPPEMHKQIFQPFAQGANYVTKEHDGAGLGLSINQHYCQLMGGRIEVESRPGEGATFSVYLPAEVTAVESMFVRSYNPGE